MKPIALISLLFLLVSCNDKTEFYLGTWELNEENEVSTLSLSESGRLNWDISGITVFENMIYEDVETSHQNVDITADQGDDCIMLTMQRLTENQFIGCNYKCYIDENMIDEVFIARKNGHPVESIQKPEKETIVLPDGYTGEFYIVYQDSERSPSREISVNDNGIGINPGKPDLKQLFNANRIFRFESQKKHIPIANPNGYGKGLDAKSKRVLEDHGVVIVQRGFNQSGRNDWNKAYGENVKDNWNIEYFEIRERIDQ